MSPIQVPLPYGESLCYPTTTQNVIQCYQDNLRQRRTYILQLENFNANNGWLRTSEDTQYNYTQYNPTGTALGQYYVILPELTGFWFPLICSILVALCFFFVYKLLFARFIK